MFYLRLKCALTAIFFTIFTLEPARREGGYNNRKQSLVLSNYVTIGTFTVFNAHNMHPGQSNGKCLVKLFYFTTFGNVLPVNMFWL